MGALVRVGLGAEEFWRALLQVVDFLECLRLPPPEVDVAAVADVAVAAWMIKPSQQQDSHQLLAPVLAQLRELQQEFAPQQRRRGWPRRQAGWRKGSPQLSPQHLGTLHR